MNGWVKMYRKIWDNPMITKDSDHLAVWVYLITNAAHKEYDMMWRGSRITLHVGQLFVSGNNIGRKLKISKSKLSRILKLFKSETQIETQTSNVGSLVTILNWEKYQSCETQSENRVGHEWDTSETHNKKERIKELKNKTPLTPQGAIDVESEFIKKIFPLYPHSENSEFMDLWMDYVQMRKKKTPMTDRAKKISLGKLGDWPLGKAIRSLELSIERSYRGLFEPDDPNPQSSKGKAATALDHLKQFYEGEKNG